MAYYHYTPQSEIERIIGAAPFDRTSIVRIDSLAKLDAARNWLYYYQKIPITEIDPMSADTLRKCYTIKKYLDVVKRNKGVELELDASENVAPPRDDDAALESLLNVKRNEVAPQGPLAPLAPVNLDATAETLARAIETKLRPAINQNIKSQVAIDLKVAMDDLAKKLELSDEAKQKVRDLATGAAQAKAKELFDAWLPPRQVEISVRGAKPVNIGLQHENFELLLRVCAARNARGEGLNVWLTGPTGSGKTFAAEQVAKTLNLPFYCDSSLDADYKVLGFRNAQGEYMTTPFYHAFKSGGVYVLDEIDNWNPSAILSVNAGLASGFQTFANGELVRRHKELVVIACANTWGMGATNDYVGRTKLDAATLDRFRPRLHWPVDERLEREIARQSNAQAWCDIVQTARHAAQKVGLKIIISPRATYSGIALLNTGLSPYDVAQMTIGGGLSEEQKQQLNLHTISRNVHLTSATNEDEFAERVAS